MTSPRAQLAILPLLLSSCARHPPAPANALAPAAASEAADDAPPSRTLPRDATFADLVRSAGYFNGQSEPPSASCLLSREEAGFLLSAEIGAAVRPLPQPEVDLDAQLASARSAYVLTPYGAYGAPQDAVSLASFTLFPSASTALVLLISDRGLSVRAPFAQAATAEPRLLSEGLAELDDLEGRLVFVSAEAHIPVSEVYAVLAALAQRRAVVALAVALPAGTRLPAPPESAAAVDTHCSEGLPDTQEPEGELSHAALLSGLAPLREKALACLSRGGAAGAAGGALVLSLRVDAGGRVGHACLVRSDITDRTVNACVVELARALRFAAPTPSGVVDLELPLALRPHSVPAPDPVCPRTVP